MTITLVIINHHGGDHENRIDDDWAPFIGPRYTWGLIFGSHHNIRLWCLDLIGVTLADEDTNPRQCGQ